MEVGGEVAGVKRVQERQQRYHKISTYPCGKWKLVPPPPFDSARDKTAGLAHGPERATSKELLEERVEPFESPQGSTLSPSIILGVEGSRGSRSPEIPMSGISRPLDSAEERDSESGTRFDHDLAGKR